MLASERSRRVPPVGKDMGARLTDTFKKKGVKELERYARLGARRAAGARADGGAGVGAGTARSTASGPATRARSAWPPASGAPPAPAPDSSPHPTSTLSIDREASGARSKWALEQEIGSESDVLRLFLRAIKAQKPLGRWAPHPTPRPSRARLTPRAQPGDTGAEQSADSPPVGEYRRVYRLLRNVDGRVSASDLRSSLWQSPAAAS